MHDRIIPIRDETAWTVGRALPVLEPRLAGDGTDLQALVEAVSADLTGPGGPLDGVDQTGAWLRALRVRGGEAEMRLAAELGPLGDVVAARAFDVLRRRLPDTDVYVLVEGEAAPASSRP
jgi:hypothetical protein